LFRTPGTNLASAGFSFKSLSSAFAFVSRGIAVTRALRCPCCSPTPRLHGKGRKAGKKYPPSQLAPIFIVENVAHTENGLHENWLFTENGLHEKLFKVGSKKNFLAHFRWTNKSLLVRLFGFLT